MFVRLDRAMDSGDPRMVHPVVRATLELARSSPLAGLGDLGTFWAGLGTEDRPVGL
ncbi:hypothetical protein GCM10017562_12850 [Streptomyces roseofulvus]|uniref:hypothetical protein n=1 Tax=Streptomyces roseofulvus TaxID=33902 RepID=UPI0031F9E8C5